MKTWISYVGSPGRSTLEMHALGSNKYNREKSFGLGVGRAETRNKIK